MSASVLRWWQMLCAWALAGLCACQSTPNARIAWIALGPDPTLQECQAALVAALAQAGWHEGLNLAIDRYDLGGHAQHARPLWEALDQRGYDALLGFTTPVARAAAEAPLQTPVLIAYCFDLRAAGIDATRPWLRGVEMPPPLEAIAQRLIEWKLHRVGVVYNPDEANSVGQVERVRALLEPHSIRLLAAPARNASEALSAVEQLRELKVDGAWKLGDNTLKEASEAMIRAWAAAGVPVLGDHPRQLAWGAREVISIDFEEVGRLAAEQLAKFLAAASWAELSSSSRIE